MGQMGYMKSLYDETTKLLNLTGDKDKGKTAKN